MAQGVAAQQIHPNPLITSSGTPLCAGEPIHCSGCIFIWQDGGRSENRFAQSQILSLLSQKLWKCESLGPNRGASPL